MYPVGNKDSVQPGNRYTFSCPVTGRDTLYLLCATKRNRHYKGQDFHDHDCRCAMNANRCPIIHMLQMEWREGKPLFMDDDAAVLHRLPKQVAERIERVQVLPYHGAGLTLTPEQKEQLFGNRLAEVPARAVEALPNASAPPVRKRIAQTVREAKNDLAAGLGGAVTDMSSLINASMENK